MCVAVTLNPGAELSVDEIFKMGNANGDGFGLAWAEEGVVHWWKTLVYDADYMTYLVNSLKDFSRFVHFRLATIGGIKAELCHPFEIGPYAGYATKGHANKVLMHNGHWTRAGEIFDILKKENALPDSGPWSDTRLAAFLASWDEDWLTTVTGRVATLDGSGNMKLIGYWDTLREGIKVSNKHWDHNYDYRRTGAGRRWEGWGWSDKHWMAKEAHDKEKKEKEEKEKAKQDEKEAKEAREANGKNVQGEKGNKKAKEKEGEPSDAQRRDLGMARSYGQLPPGGNTRPSGPGDTGAQGKNEEGKKWDLRPWQNPDSGVWYQVDPTSAKGRVRVISESEARKALESVASSNSEEGGNR